MRHPSQSGQPRSVDGDRKSDYVVVPSEQSALCKSHPMGNQAEARPLFRNARHPAATLLRWLAPVYCSTASSRTCEAAFSSSCFSKGLSNTLSAPKFWVRSASRGARPFGSPPVMARKRVCGDSSLPTRITSVPLEPGIQMSVITRSNPSLLSRSRPRVPFLELWLTRRIDQKRNFLQVRSSPLAYLFSIQRMGDNNDQSRIHRRARHRGDQTLL
jgi:hypothetical protein